MAAGHALEISDTAIKHGLSGMLQGFAKSKIGDESRSKYLESIGHVMGQEIAAKLELRGKTVRVGIPSDDMDALGASFVRALNGHGASVRIACLWLERSTIHHVFPEPREIARIVQEYIEPLEGRPEHLILIESASSRPSIMETFVRRLSKEAGGASIHVLTPVTVWGAWLELRDRLPEDLAERLGFSAMAWAREETPELLPEECSHRFPKFLIDRIRRRSNAETVAAG